MCLNSYGITSVKEKTLNPRFYTIYIQLLIFQRDPSLPRAHNIGLVCLRAGDRVRVRQLRPRSAGGKSRAGSLLSALPQPTCTHEQADTGGRRSPPQYPHCLQCSSPRLHVLDRFGQHFIIKYVQKDYNEVRRIEIIYVDLFIKRDGHVLLAANPGRQWKI